MKERKQKKKCDVGFDHRPSPFKEENKDKIKVLSSNLEKLKDSYGEASTGKGKDASSEEFIRLEGDFLP